MKTLIRSTILGISFFGCICAANPVVAMPMGTIDSQTFSATRTTPAPPSGQVAGKVKVAIEYTVGNLDWSDSYIGLNAKISFQPPAYAGNPSMRYIDLCDAGDSFVVSPLTPSSPCILNVIDIPLYEECSYKSDSTLTGSKSAPVYLPASPTGVLSTKTNTAFP